MSDEDIQQVQTTYDNVNDLCSAFPALSRDLGAGVLEYVASSTDTVNLHDDSDFALDSLYCEWAYVVDLDENEFHVYQGFNDDPDANCELFHKLLKESLCIWGWRGISRS